MQRVIAQLSETKDPKLFNKKINKLLDLFDKWEGNMIEREQALLQGTSKKVSEDQYTEQRQKEVAQLQQQKDLEERIIRVEEKERTLFAEKARLEEILEELNAAEMNMEHKKLLVETKKQEQAEKKARREALQSRINEKGQELAEKREIYNQRLARLEEESIGVSNEKNRVMKDWQNVIGQAENLRLAEKEKLALQEQLKVVGEQIQQQNLILERKYQSLHNMHQHQAYKQAIDQREQALRLKEENIKLLAKELAVLQNTQTNLHRLPIQQQQSQQSSQYSYQPNSQRFQPNKQSQQQQQQFQNIMHTQNVNISNTSSLLSRSQDPHIKQQLLLQMPPLFPAAQSNDPSTLAASSKKIKQKFTINQQSQDEDSQIQSPISSAINPLLTTVSASPLNETSISRINHIPEESVIYQQYDPTMNFNLNNSNNSNGNFNGSNNNMTSQRNGNYQAQSSQVIQNQQESEYFQSLLAKKQQLLSRYEEMPTQGDTYHWRQQPQQYF